jgi:hypothetical protein
LVSGILADVASKYPDATGNQLIQSLVRNSGSQAHELPAAPDPVMGYGTVNLSNMLRVDPAVAYEDVNPLIVPDDGQPLGLTADEIANAGRPDWAGPAPSATSTGSPGVVPPVVGPSSGGVSVWVWSAAVGGLVGTLTVVVVVARRRHQARGVVGATHE